MTGALRWTGDRIVTFALTLAASRSVTRAAAAAGMSRKSAYTRRGSDPAFAALWGRALAAADAARREAASGRRPGPREGDEVEEVHDLPISITRGDGRDLSRSAADAERDLFFSGLQSRLPAATRRPRLGSPLAKRCKQSEAGGFEERRERLWSDSGAR